MDDFEVDKLYSYILKHDTGFSPNPFHRICTLACCKPAIRRSVGKQRGFGNNIWIVGITPKSQGNEIAYMMKVDEVLTFEEYYQSHPEKRPIFGSSVVAMAGDNIYQPTKDGFVQLRSIHSDDPFDDEKWSISWQNHNHDLGGKYVLVSRSFIYFGRNSISIPNELRWMIPGRGHRCNFYREQILGFKNLVNHFQNEISSGSVIGPPRKWPKDNQDWVIDS